MNRPEVLSSDPPRHLYQGEVPHNLEDLFDANPNDKYYDLVAVDEEWAEELYKNDWEKPNFRYIRRDDIILWNHEFLRKKNILIRHIARVVPNFDAEKTGSQIRVPGSLRYLKKVVEEQNWDDRIIKRKN